MIDKKLSLIISFNKTTDAMAFEEYCLKNSINGRLIPLPKEISAGCGLSWKCEISQEEEVIVVLRKTNIICENITTLVI